MNYNFTDFSRLQIPYKELIIHFYNADYVGTLEIRKYPKRYFLAYESTITLPESDEIIEGQLAIFAKILHKELSLRHVKEYLIASGATNIRAIELFNLIADMENLCEAIDDEPYDNGGHPDNFGDN